MVHHLLILGNQVGWMGRLLFRWPANSEILLPPAIHNMKNPGWGTATGGNDWRCGKKQQNTDLPWKSMPDFKGVPIFRAPNAGASPIEAIRSEDLMKVGPSPSLLVEYIRRPEDLIVRLFFAHIHDESLILNLIMRSSIMEVPPVFTMPDTIIS
jgi:hypothetical protein